MKSKAIISLILMAVLVLGTAMALADNFTASPLTSVSGGGWLTTSGIFAANSGNNGIISTSTIVGRAVHAVTTDASGAFTFESSFRVNNNHSDVHPGVSSGAQSGDVCVGWNAQNNQFIVVKDNSNILATLGGTLDPSATYTAKISSTDGKNFTCGVYQGGALVGTTATVAGFKPTYVVVYIENYNATTGPTVYSVNFQSGNATSTPTATPTPNGTTVKTAINLQAMRDFYAKQPVVHMSNQSVIYNPDGTIKQVITGTQTTPAPTVKPNATVAPNATAVPNATVMPTVPVNATVAPTKTQAPGFEIFLAAIGMISALVLITRKKK